jgi:hypothetical protein
MVHEKAGHSHVAGGIAFDDASNRQIAKCLARGLALALSAVKIWVEVDRM